MKGALRWLAIFTASLLAAKLIESLLTSRPGRQLMERTGSTALLSDEGMDIVRKYSKDAVSVVMEALLSHSVGHGAAHTRRGWTNTIEDAGEIISALGSLLRVAADFWREREQLGERRGY